MTEDEINKLADLLYDKIMEKQEIADEEYAQQMARLMGQGYIIEDVTDKLGINEEEKLVGELAKMQTIMMILEDKEEYEKAAVILKKIKNINKKLNDGSGKY
jgi:phage terminase large subunit-like protein|tara:strand:+ start:229 stop:534 length:306 start_codon:yes stop_codon:yes gene_type:complete